MRSRWRLGLRGILKEAWGFSTVRMRWGIAEASYPGAGRGGGELGPESGRPPRGGGELVHAGEGARDEAGIGLADAGRAGGRVEVRGARLRGGLPRAEAGRGDARSIEDALLRGVGGRDGSGVASGWRRPSWKNAPGRPGVPAEKRAV